MKSEKTRVPGDICLSIRTYGRYQKDAIIISCDLDNTFVRVKNH